MGKRTVSLSQNLVNTVANALPNRDKLLLLTLYETACKVSEIVDIKIGDIEASSIKIKERVVKISPNLYKQLTNFQGEEGLGAESYLFSGRQSEKITTKRVRQIVQKATLSVGKKINPEKIRQSAIAEKLRKDKVEEVREEVGLKRLDKRKFAKKEDITKLRKAIDNKRDSILLSLLLSGLKSNEITKIHVGEINKLGLTESMKRRLHIFAKENRLAENENLFLTRQNSSLTKERIFQIIAETGRAAGVEVSPRLLNNTALANALSSSDEIKLNSLVKTRSFCLHGGFIKNE